MIATIALLCILFSGGACLIGTRSQITYEGGRSPVPSSIVREIRIGSTTKEWILEKLGSPESVNDLGEGKEVLQYTSVEKREGTLSVFVVGTFEEIKEQSESFFVTLKDGIVQDFGRRRY